MREVVKRFVHVYISGWHFLLPPLTELGSGLQGAVRRVGGGEPHAVRARPGLQGLGTR